MKSQSESRSKQNQTHDVPCFDVVIVGAGFSGLYMLHRLRALGLSVRVYEAADEVGGTWYWNCYPGARCDIESVEYSYQFSEELQQEWEWTERYASQPEILSYIKHVADRFGLRCDISFNTRISAANYDEAKNRWNIETAGGESARAQFFVLASGCLSSVFMPDFPGRENFSGEILHTGSWPQEGVNFSGKKVGVIGTGSSGVQCIPLIAEQAEHLTVFQRTATYSVPAGNHPMDPVHLQQIKADYAGLRERNNATLGGFGSAHPMNERSALDDSDEDRQAQYEHRWSQVGGLLFLGAYGDLLIDAEANQTAAEFVKGKIREVINDPAVADLLSPETMIGCKRLCADTHYYATYNRANVELVDVAQAPIEEITQDGLRTAAATYELDYIVFATGFDAMTGAISKIAIQGRSGQSLKDKWADGPVNYLGVGTAGFPNLFTVVGPGNPSVLTNMVCTIEHHVGWITECIEYLGKHGLSSIEATPAAEQAWVGEVNEIAEGTLFPTCNSWYLGANIPGKARVFMPYLGLPPYKARCAEIAADMYRGFVLR